FRNLQRAIPAQNLAILGREEVRLLPGEEVVVAPPQHLPSAEPQHAFRCLVDGNELEIPGIFDEDHVRKIFDENLEKLPRLLEVHNGVRGITFQPGPERAYASPQCGIETRELRG